jgi:hypothetical protein
MGRVGPGQNWCDRPGRAQNGPQSAQKRHLCAGVLLGAFRNVVERLLDYCARAYVPTANLQIRLHIFSDQQFRNFIRELKKPPEGCGVDDISMIATVGHGGVC